MTITRFTDKYSLKKTAIQLTKQENSLADGSLQPKLTPCQTIFIPARRSGTFN